jgi:hypothetical protein
VVSLHAICERTGAVVPIPVETSTRSHAVRFSATFRLGEVFERLGPDAANAWLRLTFAWQNYSWRTPLVRTPPADGRYEIAFDDDGGMRLHRHPGPP